MSEPEQKPLEEDVTYEDVTHGNTNGINPLQENVALQIPGEKELLLENNMTQKILKARDLPIPDLNSEDLNKRTIAKLIRRLPLEKDEQVYARNKLEAIKKDAKKGRETSADEYGFVYIYNEDLISKKAIKK